MQSHIDQNRRLSRKIDFQPYFEKESYDYLNKMSRTALHLQCIRNDIAYFNKYRNECIEQTSRASREFFITLNASFHILKSNLKSRRRDIIQLLLAALISRLHLQLRVKRYRTTHKFKHLVLRTSAVIEDRDKQDNQLVETNDNRTAYLDEHAHMILSVHPSLLRKFNQKTFENIIKSNEPIIIDDEEYLLSSLIDHIVISPIRPEHLELASDYKNKSATNYKNPQNSETFQFNFPTFDNDNTTNLIPNCFDITRKKTDARYHRTHRKIENRI